MNLRALLIATFVLLTACDTEPQFTFGFEDAEMRKFVADGLQKREIWYRLEDRLRITIYEKDMPMVKQLGYAFGERTIPFGRSTGVNAKAQPTIEKALKKAGVKYRISTYGAATLPPDAEELGMSAEWIVFEPGHEEKGFEIINEVTRDFDFWAE